MKIVSGVDKILKSLNSIDANVMDTKELNRKRATAFREYTIFQAKTDGLGLKQIKQTTQRIQGKFHSPLYQKGTLIAHMGIRARGLKDESQAGYFADDNSKPAGSALSWFKIALIQTIGYRIPLQGAKGEKVRRFLAVFGIFPKKSRNFLYVTPRPFLLQSSMRYQRNDGDSKIVEAHFNKAWRTI